MWAWVPKCGELWLFIFFGGLSFMKDVSSNHLGARGCQWMCDMLQNNVTLLKINLSDNNFNDKDTVFLLDALKVQNSLIDWFAYLRQTANVNHLYVRTKFSLYFSVLFSFYLLIFFLEFLKLNLNLNVWYKRDCVSATLRLKMIILTLNLPATAGYMWWGRLIGYFVFDPVSSGKSEIYKSLDYPVIISVTLSFCFFPEGKW